MFKMATRISLVVCSFLITVAAKAELKTVPYVDPAQYLGTWYQIARNPMFFEQGCFCPRQVLGGLPDGKISVYNSCSMDSITGKVSEIRGTATNDDPTSNSRFTVDFGLPHKGQYWIIGLDPQYRFAVVSDPSLVSLYILSKEPTLAPELFAAAKAMAAQQTDTSKLIIATQQGCTYP